MPEEYDTMRKAMDDMDFFHLVLKKQVAGKYECIHLRKNQDKIDELIVKGSYLILAKKDKKQQMREV